MMNKRKFYQLSMLLIVIFCGIGIVKIAQMPHSLTTSQILKRFSWQVKVAGCSQGNARFASSTFKITTSHSVKNYRYSVNDDDVLTINDGRLAGKYDLKMDAIDYQLIPQTTHRQKISLIRND